MCRVLTIYKVSRVGLHGEIKAVRLASFNGDVGGSFVECAGRLKRCVLVNRNTDGVIVGGISWRCKP